MGAVKVTVTQDNVTDQGDKKDPVKEEADGVVGLKHNTMIPCWGDMEHTWGWWNTVVEHSVATWGEHGGRKHITGAPWPQRNTVTQAPLETQ